MKKFNNEIIDKIKSNIFNNIKIIEYNLSKNNLSKSNKIACHIYNNIKDAIGIINEIGNEIKEQEIKEIDHQISNLKELCKEDILNSYILSNNDNSKNCYLEINSGTGGDDSQNCALILFDMYLKWAKKNKIKHSIIEKTTTKTGIRDCLLLFEFKNAYGILNFEHGIHRIIRNSPYNTQSKRQTSFVSVYVYPYTTNSEIEIQNNDLKIETMKSSGAGGQHVNTTNSAVRIKHIPTGITVKCQQDRSQHKNKEIALSVIYSKLKSHLQIDKSDIKGENINATWGGSQIRTYVFDPYKKIKDHRYNFEYNNILKVLNGNLDIILYSRFFIDNFDII